MLNPSAQPFNYEDSLGYSAIRCAERECAEADAEGHFAAGDVSRMGTRSTMRRRSAAERPTVAQNDQDLDAEESNSSFDVRHKLTGNWVLELPFGPNRAFLNKGGLWSKTLDGFSLSGDFTFATGTYYTPTLCGDGGGDCFGQRTIRCGRTGYFAQPISGAGTFGLVQHGGVRDAGEWTFGTASRDRSRGRGRWR